MYGGGIFTVLVPTGRVVTHGAVTWVPATEQLFTCQTVSEKPSSIVTAYYLYFPKYGGHEDVGPSSCLVLITHATLRRLCYTDV